MVTKATQRQLSETSHYLSPSATPSGHSVNLTPAAGAPSRQISGATMRQDGGDIQRRKSAKKTSFKFRKRASSPYGLRRQTSQPITERDHTSFNQSKHSESVAMAITKQSAQADPVVKPLSPSNGTTTLTTTKQQPSSCVATQCSVTRVPLTSTMATSKQNRSTNSENLQPGGATATCNHGDDAVVVGNHGQAFGEEVSDNAEFLYHVHVYGVLLRKMGDQLDEEYGNHGNTQHNNNQLLSQGSRIT